MKKTYELSDILTHAEVLGLAALAKKQIKNSLYYCLYLTPLWKLHVDEGCLELELLQSPIPKSKIVVNVAVLPSIKKIKPNANQSQNLNKKQLGNADRERRDGKCYRVSEKDAYLVKIVDFINSFILKANFNTENQTELDLGILGYFRSRKFQADYFNSKGLLKWSLVNCPSRPKLDEIVGVQTKEKNSRNPRNTILSSDNSQMERKFSLGSFKQYSVQKCKQFSHSRPSSRKSRVKSLPSISQEQAKTNHKLVLKKIQTIMQNQRNIKTSTKNNYLKIEQRPRRQSKYRSKINSKPQQGSSLNCSESSSKIFNQLPSQPSDILKQTKSLKYTEEQKQFNEQKISFKNLQAKNIDNQIFEIGSMKLKGQTETENEIDEFIRDVNEKTMKSFYNSEQLSSNKIVSMRRENKLMYSKQSKKEQQKKIEAIRNLTPPKSSLPRPLSQTLKQSLQKNQKLGLSKQTKCRPHISFNQPKQSQDTSEFQKQTIRRLLSSNSSLSNNKALINELHQIYVQNSSYLLLSQVFAPALQKGSNKSKRKSLIRQFSPCPTVQHQIIEAVVSEKHRTDAFMISLMNKIAIAIDDLQSIKVYDLSSQVLRQKVDFLHSLFQGQLSEIQGQIQFYIKEQLEKQKKRFMVQQKFNMFQFSNSSKNKNMLKLQIQQNELATADAENQFAPDSQKNLKRIFAEFCREKKKIYYNYYLQNYYMPYFYIVSQGIIQAIVNIFSGVSKKKGVIFIELKKIKELPETLSQYMEKIESVHKKFLSFFQKIPHRSLRLQQFQKQKIRQVLVTIKSDIKKCEFDWQHLIKQKYEPFKAYLEECKSVQLKFKEQAKHNPTQIYLKQRQQHLKSLTNKLQKLSKVTTYLKSGWNILDSNAAKMHLMQKYESCISKFYQSALYVMSQISLAWSQEMVRTQRLLADELAEQEHQIGVKIKYLAKDYYSLTKFALLDRKFYYLSSENDPNEQANSEQMFNSRKISAIDPTDKKSPEIKKITQNKQQKINPLQAFNEVFLKCLNYPYNMSKKNRQKIQQVSYLVQRHKQKMLFLAKSLQVKEKQAKIQCTFLTSQLKKIIKQVKCKSDLPRMQPRIKAVQVRYKSYQQIADKLHEEMAKNMMIVWEDDDFLQKNINVCVRTINFIESDIYIRINFHTVDTLRFQHFFKYYKLLEKLMIVIEGHKFEQLFQAEYDLTKKQFELIEMVLYKDYTVSQIEQINRTCSIDLRPTLTTLKIHDLLKSYRSRLSIFKDVSKVYYRRKKQKYDRNLHKEQRVEIDVSEHKEGEVAKIINYDEILITFQDSQNLTVGQKEANQRSIETVGKLMEIYETIREHQIMLKQMDDDIKQEDHVGIVLHLEKIKMYYHNALNSFRAQKNFSIQSMSKSSGSCYKQKQWDKLLSAVNELQFSFKLKQKFYSYLCDLCSRLIMLPYRLLIQLMDWSTQANILRNIKILFEEVVDVQFGPNNSIVTLYVTRGKRNDRILLSCGPIATDKVHKYGKLVRHIEKQVQRSLLLMIRNSNGRAGQIKLLYWLLYFTEQVEQSIITNSSLKILQMHLSQTIFSIKCDLRYDMQNHKQQEIAQINTFIHYISDCLGPFPEIEGWAWLSTIRAYEKNNCVMIQQNNLEFYYGFEPKSVRITESMNWNLGISVSYGDSSLKQMYKYKAYILGAPYFQIHDFNDCFLAEQRNLSKLLSSLQSNSLICSIFQPTDPHFSAIFNEIHKEIMNYYFNRLRNCRYQLEERAYSQQSEHSLEYHEMEQNKTKSKKEVLIKQNTNPELTNQSQSQDVSNSKSNEKVDSDRAKSKKKVVAIVCDSLTKQRDNGSQNSRKQSRLTAIKSKISIHMCYHSYPQIPRCFLSMYRCMRTSEINPEILTLRVHMMVQLSSISSQLKWKLIWKLIKLARCLNQLRTSTLRELLAIVQKILSIVEMANGVNKQVKNQIYCYIVEHFMADYEKASLIANQLFNVDDFVNEWALQNVQVQSTCNIQQSKQSTEHLDISQPAVSILSRQDLLAKIKDQYNEIISSPTTKSKPIIIYGEEPTCKTTFITEHLRLKLNQPGGYIEASFMNYLESPQLNTRPPQQSLTNFKVIEAGSIHELSPAIVSNCSLLYVPSIPIQGNEQYEDELKLHFETTLLNCETVPNRGTLAKMWIIAKTLYNAYRTVETSNKGFVQSIVKFNNYIDIVLKIFTQFLGRCKTQFKQTTSKPNNQNKGEQGEGSLQRQQIYLLCLVCYQYLCSALSNKLMRKQMIQLLRSMETSGKIKMDFKLDELDTMSYTCTGEIIKADSLGLSKHNSGGNNSIIRKETLFINNLMYRELNTIRRYIELRVNVCASGNSNYLMREISETLSALCQDNVLRGSMDEKVQHGESNKKCFFLHANMKSVMRIYEKLPSIYARKKMRLNLSKAMISGKIMELSSRAHIQSSAGYNPGFIGSDHILQDNRECTIILVEDLHLGGERSVSDLAAVLNRITNTDYCNYNDSFGEQISQVFVIFNNKSVHSNGASRSQRFRRFVAEVTLPELEMESIYKYRSHFMMNEEQAGLALQLFNVGLIGHSSRGQFEKVEKKKINLTEPVDDAKVRFAIETNIRMPSQFYTKFIMHKLIMDSISAAGLNLPFINFQTFETIDNLFSLMHRKQSTSNVAQRLRKYSNESSHRPLSYYISERDGKWMELDTKKIQSQLDSFISSLPFAQQLFANHLTPLLPLLTDSQVYILESTPMTTTTKGSTPLLISMLCRALKHKAVTLTHGYLNQITQQLSHIQSNPQNRTCFIVPEYLLHYAEFVMLLRSIMSAKNGSQLLVTHEGMFEYWWQLVAEFEFIHNKQHQFKFMKDKIEESIGRVKFYIVLDDMNIQKAIHILINDAGKQSNIFQSTSQQNGQNKTKWASLIESNSPNNQYEFTNISNHARFSGQNQLDHGDSLLRSITPINCRLTKNQQVQLIQQAAQHYMAAHQLTESGVGKSYAEVVLNYLIYVLQYQTQQFIPTDQQSSESSSSDELSDSFKQISARRESQKNRKINRLLQQKQKKSNDKYLLYQVLDLMPKLFGIIQQITQPKCSAMSSKSMLAGTMYSIYDQDKLTTLELIHNLAAKVTQAAQHQAELNTKLGHYRQCYQRLSQQLKDQSSHEDKNYGQSAPGNYQSCLTNLQKFYRFKSELDKYPLFKLLKQEYLSHTATDTKIKQINFSKSERLLQKICACFQLQKNNHQAYQQYLPKHEPDFVVESKTESKLWADNSRDGIGNFIQCQAGFVRLCNLNIKFSQFLRSFDETDFALIKVNLQCIQPLTNNYKQFMVSLSYSYAVVQMLREPKQSSLLLSQLEQIEHTGRLDALTICSSAIQGIETALETITNIEAALRKCITFLMEIGNYKQSSPPQQPTQQLSPVPANQITYQRNHDIEVKLELFQIISMQLLSKIKNNCHLYYKLHQLFELQSVNNILYTLDHPKILQSSKWQQIQHLVFMPLLASPIPQAQSNTNSNDNGKRTHKLSIFGQNRNQQRSSIFQPRHQTLLAQKQASPVLQPNSCLNIGNKPSQPPQMFARESKQVSRVGLPLTYIKYAIVYDPYSQLLKYIQGGAASASASYRKIVHIKNQCQARLKNTVENNEKLDKVNHVLTFYIYYFRLSIQNTQQSSYGASLASLNRVLSVLNKKDQRGLGQNDRLIILTHHQFLCQDLKKNAQFRLPLTNMSQTREVFTVSLTSSELDLIESFAKPSLLREEKVMTKHLIQNLKDKAAQKQKILQKNTNVTSQSFAHTFSSERESLAARTTKNLQTLHSECNMSKSYLKMLIKNMIDEMGGIFSQENRTDLYQQLTQRSNIGGVIKSLSDFENRKHELLNEYCEQKLINYEYYLDENNLQAIRKIYGTVQRLVEQFKINMDFVEEISDYTTIQQLIEELLVDDGIAIQKQIKISQATKQGKNKSIFYQQKSRQPVKKRKSVKNCGELQKLLFKLYQQYKASLSTSIYSMKSSVVPGSVHQSRYPDLNSGEPLSRNKMLVELANKYQIFVLVYDQFETWTVEQLLQNHNRSKIKLFFDAEPACYEMLIELVTLGNKNGTRIVFIVHSSKLGTVKEMLHSVKLFWV